VTVTRLVGGLTPGDGSDPRTFPAIWNATADVIDAVEADSLPTDVSSPVAGQKLVWDGSNWVNLTGYVFVETVYFTSSGTFSKADYPWLRAIRVKVQGAGGGGGGCPATGATQISVGGPGGGGVYAESFITDIAGLDASVTVTRGAGGAGGAAGANNGATGGTSSFGALVSANGGTLGLQGFLSAAPSLQTGGARTTTGTGNIVQDGGAATSSFGLNNDFVAAGVSGHSFLNPGGGGNGAFQTGANGISGNLGSGGSPGINAQNQATARSGGAGGNGIVIVDLYA
jgi:hypothetical protein